MSTPRELGLGTVVLETFQIHVTVAGAKGLPTFGAASACHPYCCCEISGEPASRFQTEVCPNATEPVWSHMAEIAGVSAGHSLDFEVSHYDPVRGAQLIGKARLESERFVPSGFEGEVHLLNERAQEVGTLAIGVVILPDIAPVKSVPAVFGINDSRTLLAMGHVVSSRKITREQAMAMQNLVEAEGTPDVKLPLPAPPRLEPIAMPVQYGNQPTASILAPTPRHGWNAGWVAPQPVPWPTNVAGSFVSPMPVGMACPAVQQPVHPYHGVWQHASPARQGVMPATAAAVAPHFGARRRRK